MAAGEEILYSRCSVQQEVLLINTVMLKTAIWNKEEKTVLKKESKLMHKFKQSLRKKLL